MFISLRAQHKYHMPAFSESEWVSGENNEDNDEVMGGERAQGNKLQTRDYVWVCIVRNWAVISKNLPDVIHWLLRKTLIRPLTIVIHTTQKTKPYSRQSLSTMGGVLALHMADMGFMPVTTNDPLSSAKNYPCHPKKPKIKNNPKQTNNNNNKRNRTQNPPNN